MRRRKRTGIILLGVIMLSLLTVSGIYGFSEKKVTNHLQTGVVLLELKQYEQDTEGKIRPLQKKRKFYREGKCPRFREFITKEIHVISDSGWKRQQEKQRIFYHRKIS